LAQHRAPEEAVTPWKGCAGQFLDLLLHQQLGAPALPEALNSIVQDAGLVVLGVHTPEFGFEKHRANVVWAVREFRITFPVAMDNKYRVWQAFQNEYWPAFYVIDAKGRTRYRRFGKGNMGKRRT
jgi:hypothetical protein